MLMIELNLDKNTQDVTRETNLRSKIQMLLQEPT
jgi:hypothetical protein